MTPTVGVNGPVALVENAPVGEDEENVATTGAAGRAGTPATCACTVIAPDTAPATTEGGVETNASVVGDHARNARQLAVRRAPSRSPAHQRFRPLGPQARTPGSAGVSVAESRIAVASRSSTAPVIAAQSAAGSDEEFRGDHANPQWSLGRPERTLWLRSA